MSRHINVNPGNYKVAGRERQGEAIHQSSEKGAYAQQREEMRLRAIEAQAGPPAWETTPPNLDIPDRPQARAPKGPKGTKRAKEKTKTRTRKQARKAAPKRKVARVTASKRSSARASSSSRRRATRARRGSRSN
jgi:hypothetical protein